MLLRIPAHQHEQTDHMTLCRYGHLHTSKQLAAVYRPGVFVLTYLFDSPGIRKIVCNNLSHLREMPSIPLSATHAVVIQLLV